MASPNCSLKVNRELLDPSFESYRLSLDSIPTYNIELDAGEKKKHLFYLLWSDFIHCISVYLLLQCS